jgi:hypothetical protein
LADTAFLLTRTDDAEKGPAWLMLLRQEKSRDGETTDAALLFHRRVQRFERDPFLVTASPSPPIAARGREVWGSARRNGKGASPAAPGKGSN